MKALEVEMRYVMAQVPPTRDTRMEFQDPDFHLASPWLLTGIWEVHQLIEELPLLSVCHSDKMKKNFF